jgi:hypothetical protein
MFYTEEMVKAHKLDRTCSICGEPAHAFIPLKGNRKALEICHRCAVTVLPGIVGETIISSEEFLDKIENMEGHLDTSKLVMDVNFWKHVACAMPKVLKNTTPPEKSVKRRPGRPRKKTKKASEPVEGGGSVVPFSKGKGSTSTPSQDAQPTPSQPQIPGVEVTEKTEALPKTGEVKVNETVRRRSTKGKGATE